MGKTREILSHTHTLNSQWMSKKSVKGLLLINMMELKG